MQLWNHKLRALIVDDEESARRLMVKLLEETLFFQKSEWLSVDSAFSELDNFEPDIIFLDIKMPGKNGIEFVNDTPF